MPSILSCDPLFPPSKEFLEVRNSPSFLAPLSSIKGGNTEDLDDLRIFTRKSSKSSEDSPPHSWGGVGGGVDKSALRTSKLPRGMIQGNSLNSAIIS
jgi:hypothetical protein